MTSCEISLIIAEYENNLAKLLEFIQGKGHHWGKGIFTHPNYPDENQQKIHNALLELERRKLVYRHYEDEEMIAWMPIE